jgi:hypothetical protein
MALRPEGMIRGIASEISLNGPVRSASHTTLLDDQRVYTSLRLQTFSLGERNLPETRPVSTTRGNLSVLNDGESPVRSHPRGAAEPGRKGK